MAEREDAAGRLEGYDTLEQVCLVQQLLHVAVAWQPILPERGRLGDQNSHLDKAVPCPGTSAWDCPEPQL